LKLLLLLFTLCDVGAGAGFPSIPLKIVFPELKVTIVDSLNKVSLATARAVTTSYVSLLTPLPNVSARS
jgi:16S rRNA G1207 methylase RsmC